MKAFEIRLATIAVIFASALHGDSPILQSDTPMPAELTVAVQQELASTGAWGELQSGFVVRIHGVCRVSVRARQGGFELPLGWVDRVDGQMLAIIHVDCSRIGQALARIAIDPGSVETRQMYARAIARVVRHELRHVLLNTANHEKRGEDKAALTAEELVAPSFSRASR